MSNRGAERGASALLPREAGRERMKCEGARGLRCRGADEDGVLARPDSPNRWTLPITALRVMPPSSPAIWLAERPSAHNFLSVSTRSSVHVHVVMGLFPLRTHAAFLCASQNPITVPGSPHRADPGLRHTGGTQETARRTRYRIRQGPTYNMRGLARKSQLSRGFVFPSNFGRSAARLPLEAMVARLNGPQT